MTGTGSVWPVQVQYDRYRFCMTGTGSVWPVQVQHDRYRFSMTAVQVQYDRYRFSMTGTGSAWPVLRIIYFHHSLVYCTLVYCAAFLTNFCFIKLKNVHHYTHQRVAIFVLKIKRNVMILKCAGKSSFLQLRLHLKKLYRHKWEIIFFKLASLCTYISSRKS